MSKQNVIALIILLGGLGISGLLASVNYQSNDNSTDWWTKVHNEMTAESRKRELFPIDGSDFYKKNYYGIHYKGKLIEGADIDTFFVMDRSQNIAQDRNFVYWKGEVWNDADLLTIEVLENNYSKDRNHVYDPDGKIIDGVDPETFVFIPNSPFAKDKNNVYIYARKIWQDELKHTVIPGLNSISFLRIDDSYFFSDGKRVFGENGREVEAANIDKFIILGNKYAHDNARVWAVTETPFGKTHVEIKGADPHTFELLGNGYARDKNSVYYGELRLDGLKNAYVEIRQDFILGDNAVYHKNKRLMNADYKTFEILNKTYVKDKNRVWFIRNVEVMFWSEIWIDEVLNADAATFEVDGPNIGHDKNGIIREWNGPPKG
ncbi:MAG: DKNYY domain-containing protein [Patescibacteria group bacterium]